MHKSFPFQCIFSMSLPTFQKGVHCTKALDARGALCAVRGVFQHPLGQPKIFRCGSLCCCVGDCVVGHCHLYPLHSWQDILLTFAEIELDSTTMLPPLGQM